MKVAFNMRMHQLVVVLIVPLLGCSSSSGGAPASADMRIVTVSGAPLMAAAGDGLALKVVETMPDGSTMDLPEGAKVAWSGPPTVTATSLDGTAADNAYPATGSAPTAMWIANPARTDRGADLAGVLFVLDPGSAANGSVTVTATVTGSVSGSASASVAVSGGPDGDARRGAMIYGKSGANCAECHGDRGKGSPMPGADGSYLIDGQNYSFPAPPIDGEMGNAAAEWSPALFAIASRADLDDEAVTLRIPMPDWLGSSSPATNKPLTTQDFADIYAFLKTQQ